MLQKNAQQHIADVLGIGLLPPKEQEMFLNNVGELILETSLIRLVAELTTEEEIALAQYVETEPQPEVLIEHLLKHHSSFKNIFKQEVQIFTNEAKKVFAVSNVNEATSSVLQSA